MVSGSENELGEFLLLLGLLVVLWLIHFRCEREFQGVIDC